MDVAGLAWGPVDGPPVLALHGWLDNAASFEPLAQHLDPSLRVVAIDLPGHGRSGRRGAGAGYHDVDWAADALEAAGALGWSRFSLLGHSMGAKIAAMAAAAWPERVERLVCLEALGPMRVPAEAVPHRLARYAKQRGRLVDRAPRVLADMGTAIERLVAGGVALSRENAERLAVRGVAPAAGGVAITTDARLDVFSPATWSDEQVDALLAAIACPTLLVTARSGFGIDPALLARHKAQVRDLRHVEVDGRHYVHMDDPATIAGLIAAHVLSASSR